MPEELARLLAVAVWPAVLALPGASAAQEVVARWPLSEGRGATVRDAGAGEHHGTVHGASWVEGRDGAALSFDGEDDYVQMPLSADYAFDSREPFTVDFWVRTSQPDFSCILMTKDEPRGKVSYSFILNREPGKVSFEVWSWAGTKLISTASVGDGKWHHLLGAHDPDSGIALLYVDDELDTAMPVGSGGPTQVELRLGNNLDAHQPFAGEISDLRICRGLSPEISDVARERYQWTVLAPGEVDEMAEAYLERVRGPHPPQADTRAQWEARRRYVRRYVLDCLGLWPLPKRLPLNVHTAGETDRGGYVIRRVYWQTWPHYYASGYLYLPKGSAAPAPAVLHPHGHWENGARNATVQARLIALALKGYVGLAVDSVHLYDWATGIVPLTVMVWNDIRGVDLLASLPEVDDTRIGVTGCSGGGQQSFYLMAVEDRLKAAVPVAMVSDFRRILSTTSAHCSCNHVPGVLAETDEPEISAVFAPRPALYISDTQDWTQWFPEDNMPQLREVWGLYGAEGRVANEHHDWHHDYNQNMREQAYAWFSRWLRGIEDLEQAKEPAHEPLSVEQLAALDDPPDDALGIEAIVEEFRERRGFRFSLPDDVGEADQRLARLRGDLRRLLRQHDVPPTDLRPVVREVRVRETRAEYKVVFNSEPEVRVPGVLIVPKRGGQCGAAILVHPEGKTALLGRSDGPTNALLNANLAVFCIDPRFYGEWDYHTDAQELNGIIVGRPPGAVGAWDIAQAAAYLRTRSDIDAARITVAGYGEAGALALFAAALDEGLAGVVAPELGRTYAQGRDKPLTPHLLTVADLPEIAAALAPRRVLLGGVADEEAFGVTRSAYARLRAADQLRVQGGPVDDAGVAQWLEGG